MIEFKPFCRLYSGGSGALNVVIAFDSNVANDTQRTLKMNVVTFQDLESYTVEIIDNFTDATYFAEINLIQNKVHGSTKINMANLCLPLELNVLGNESFNLDLQSAIRNGAISALRDAFNEFYIPSISTLNNEPTNSKGSVLNDFKNTNAFFSRYRTKMLAVIIVIPVVVWLLIWVLMRSITPVDPIGDAVNHALSSNVDSANAQVELTKNTLKSMGYDPSKASDVGCLTK